ncbi:hypothetical protein [Vibrio crassostreae]|uniref:hypothetical protein n=1 Tax=Vibrio crassostreae TaxID=246167 RepID=UPI001B3162D0|nr:hypothetical protein [Vibrio crassostreae]
MSHSKLDYFLDKSRVLGLSYRVLLMMAVDDTFEGFTLSEIKASVRNMLSNISTRYDFFMSGDELESFDSWERVIGLLFYTLTLVLLFVQFGTFALFCIPLNPFPSFETYLAMTLIPIFSLAWIGSIVGINEMIIAKQSKASDDD